MAHALAAFIQERTDQAGWGSSELARRSGLSKQLCSNYLKDDRERVSRLPDRQTVVGFAKAFHVPVDFVIGKAIESLGIGYESGDFINSVETATNEQLLAEIRRRLDEGRGGVGGRPLSVVPPTVDDAVAADQDEDPDLAAGEAEEPVHP